MTPSKYFSIALRPAGARRRTTLAFLPTKTLPILPLLQFALHAWGTDFELIGAVDDVFRVEHASHLREMNSQSPWVTPSGLSIYDAQQLVAARAFQFDLDDFDTSGCATRSAISSIFATISRSIHARFQ